jgi:hypothetical protein
MCPLQAVEDKEDDFNKVSRAREGPHLSKNNLLGHHK